MATLFADEGITARAVMRCWGDFALTDAITGKELKPRSRKARALLAYLATHPGKPIGRERLMGLLWGERGEEQARGSLRQTLFELRGLARSCGLLHIDREGVTLDPDALITDIEALEKLCAARDHHRLLAALPDTHDVLFANLDGLDPCFDDWLQIERTRRIDALASLIDTAAHAAATALQPKVARALRLRLAELTPAQPPADMHAVASPVVAPVHAAAAATAVARSWPGVATALLLAAAPVAVAGLVLRPQAALLPVVDAPSKDGRELYAAARAELHDRNATASPVAEALLRRAVAIDPGFAPAWVSLGSVLARGSPSEERLAEAERYVRRGLALAPEMAEAHGTLGMVLGYKTAEARAAIKRAATLDPKNPQIQLWLSRVYLNEGDYQRWMEAAQRAGSLDPTWHRATGTAALATWEMGHGAEALVYRERLRRINFAAAFNCEYAEDWVQGDYSAIIEETRAARPKLDDADEVDIKLGFALLTLGYRDEARLLLRLPDDVWHFVRGAVPTGAVFNKLHDQARHDAFAWELLPIAVTQLLNAGRAAEIVAVLRDPESPLGMVTSENASANDLQIHGVNVALALRMVGRSEEAEALLARVTRSIRRSQELGPVPNWLHASAAQSWAAQGDRDRALAELRKAIDLDWHYTPRAPFPDIADVPAFRQLRGDARFEQLRGRLRADLERERREAALLEI